MTIEEIAAQRYLYEDDPHWNRYQQERIEAFKAGATEQRVIDISKVCADNVITSIAKVMLDSTISGKTKAELVRVILTKAIEK